MWDLVGNPEDRFSDVAAHICVMMFLKKVICNKVKQVFSVRNISSTTHLENDDDDDDDDNDDRVIMEKQPKAVNRLFRQ